MSLIEYLDRTGQRVSRKFFEKYKNENRSYSEWELLTKWYNNRRQYKWL